MKKYVFLLLFLLSANIYSQEFCPLVSVAEIKEISILEFSSDESCEKLINVGNIKKLREALYLALLVSVDNITNHGTTRTIIPDTPYKYRYIVINDSLEIEILEKDLFRYIYDPWHPDAIKTEEDKMQGFVKYPYINCLIEERNVTKILNILFKINQ